MLRHQLNRPYCCVFDIPIGLTDMRIGCPGA
jgi:hypothetical protein